jgi:hypothetical protein
MSPVTVECPSHFLSECERLRVTIKVTYDRVTNENSEAVSTSAKPISFHKIDLSGFRLDRRCHDYISGDLNNDARDESHITMIVAVV